VRTSVPQLENISKNQLNALREIHLQFTPEDAMRVKEIENITNHDVKAVEYFIKEKFDEPALSKYKEFIHFALTSQDANNTALPLSILDALNAEYYPLMQQLVDKLDNLG
jgi:adenylosuccinate lyase